ncbi:immunoglobulin A1 protease-like [Saccostrea cucullata]|uniref:immunoglobulin A1 protease-like n=1 Tax=Saccostrea cuccullata TaxID=36930 RepID=UPI002ED3598A
MKRILSHGTKPTRNEWLARFQTKDRGQQLSEQVVIDCSICQGSAGCSYVENCNSDSVKATAICGNEDDLLPPTQGTGETSTITSTSRAITAAPAPKTGIGDDAKQAIAITVSLVVVVTVLIIIGVVCIRKRRQKSGKPDEVPGEKLEKNIAIGSERDKVHVSVELYKKESIKSKTSVPESPTPISTQKGTPSENPRVSTQKDTQRENPPVSKQRDTGNETSKWKDKKQLKESEVVAGTSSIGNTDEAEPGQTDGLLQKPTTEIDKEKKLYDNYMRINTENKVDNNPNNKESPEDKSKIMKVENVPYYTDIVPENKTKDPEEIPTTDIKSTETKEASKTAPESTKEMEINVPHVDKSKTSQSKDGEVKLPVANATTNSIAVPTTISGNSVNKKNVSIIQVSKF